MVLKVLGYTTQDFGDSWPYGQMGLANSLEITKNVNAEQGEALTRRQVARLIYNTLDTKIKDNQSKLITSVFDSKVIEGPAALLLRQVCLGPLGPGFIGPHPVPEKFHPLTVVPELGFVVLELGP